MLAFLSPSQSTCIGICVRLRLKLKRLSKLTLHSRFLQTVTKGEWFMSSCDLLTSYLLTCTYCPTPYLLYSFHRFLVRINPDSTKCSAKEQTSRKTGRVVKRKTSYMNPHVISFIRDFTEFSWLTD